MTETGIQKLRAFRHLCEVAGQPFYVELLDEILESFLEVRPCLDRQGHVVSYDLCPVRPEDASGPVTASVYSGEETAYELARCWNAR